MSKQDHTYRKQDVTGALAFIKSLMEWDLMPKDDQPKTDREAAALFFQIDRSNSNMGEFMASLKEFTVAELDRLSKEKRKPPKQAKKRIGTLNVLTGRYSALGRAPREVRGRFPEFLTLPASQYDKLLDLVKWADSAPACVELSDRAWESIHDTMVDCMEINEAQWPGVFVDSVQIETTETMQGNITPGTLVALLSHEDEDGDDTEHHCVLVRGNEDDE